VLSREVHRHPWWSCSHWRLIRIRFAKRKRRRTFIKKLVVSRINRAGKTSFESKSDERWINSHAMLVSPMTDGHQRISPATYHSPSFFRRFSQRNAPRIELSIDLGRSTLYPKDALSGVLEQGDHHDPDLTDPTKLDATSQSPWRRAPDQCKPRPSKHLGTFSYRLFNDQNNS
jgi:hypothetical protein